MAKLNIGFEEKHNIEPKTIDMEISKYIYENKDNYYDEIIAEDDRWEVFYHLSSMRRSLFSWYDFKKESELLEIGGEFGALTGLFCEKCKAVTTVETSLFKAEAIQKRYCAYDNLEIYVGKIDEINFKKKFDYIVLTGNLGIVCFGEATKDKYAEYLTFLLKYLKEDGKLLIATENRYGLKYFCGAAEEYTGRPFEGINGYPKGTEGYSFSREELKQIMEMVGLNKHKFYYPLPDYKLPQLIYSEEFLPKRELKERLIPYYINNRTLIALESDIYEDVIDNGVFEFFANSFLVECSVKSEASKAIFAAVTTDRGKENAFATVINSDDTVLKLPLYKEGIQSMEKIYSNLKDMEERGIKIIPHKVEKDGLIMPFIDAPTLSEYIGKANIKDSMELLKIFDELYNCILNSSDHVRAEENQLFEDEKMDFGPILQKAYIDMIPFNCFYINKELHFFDQEFVKHNFPAKYVLFRAIKYTYLFNEKAEEIMPLEKLKDKYNLNHLWNIFEKEEAKFVGENRRYNTYRQFYKWSNVNKNHIKANQNLLLQGEFVYDIEECGKLKGQQQVQLDLLKEFIKICKENNLIYYAVHGTLLGAVRHKGFIPWDDDIDVAMPRSDYEKLKELAPIVFKKPYAFQCNENDKEYFRGNLSRLRNMNTTGMEYEEVESNSILGIWIDIIALDYIYLDPVKRGRQIDLVQYYQKLLIVKTYGVDFEVTSKFKLKERIKYYFKSKFLSRNHLIRKFNDVCKTCKEDEAGYLGSFTRFSEKENCKFIDKGVFSETTEIEFEDIKIKVPLRYNNYLSKAIGSNFMKYPPLKERSPKHDGIFKVDIPYIRFTGTFKNASEKKFIIFGSGQMFDHYMQNYGEKFKPIFIVDNNEKKWDTSKFGIIIKAPEEILKQDLSSLRIVICSIYYKEIGQQLINMGIEEYYIYIQDKHWL